VVGPAGHGLGAVVGVVLGLALALVLGVGPDAVVAVLATGVAVTAVGVLAGGTASAGMGSPSHPSPSQYRWVVGSAGSLYHPGSMALTP
jgi:hypothetical protein